MLSRLSARSRLQLAVAAFVALLAVGTAGYRIIEGWNWFDSLYHTVITLATVGYQEVHPLSVPGRAFTIGLVLVSLVTLALALQAMTSLVIEGDLESFFWRRRMSQDIGKLNDHVLVCGYGLTGRRVAVELATSRIPFVVIEKAGENLRLALESGCLAVEGDATQDATLVEAGVERARAAVVALSSDADSVFATLSLRVLNKSLRIVSRYDEETTREKLLRAGADDVVSPKLIGGHRLATLVLRPATAGFLDAALFGDSGLDLQFDEFELKAGSELAGKSLEDATSIHDLDVRVVALVERGRRPAYLPGAKDVIPEGATLVVVGRTQDVRKLRKLEAAR